MNRRDTFEIIPRMGRARAAKSPGTAAPGSARGHVLAMMREQLEAIRAHEAGTKEGTDPEQLHKMRTAVRRLRSILGASREMFDPKWVEDFRRELDRLGRFLGDVRDLDVFRQYLHAELSALNSTGRPEGRALL